MGSFSRRCGVPLPCTNRFGRFRMLFSRSLPRQHISADRSKISFAFSDDPVFASLCCSNDCAKSNDSPLSPLLFHHFCSREILSGSCSFHAVGLVRDPVPCEHSRHAATLLATKWDALLMAIGVSCRTGTHRLRRWRRRFTRHWRPFSLIHRNFPQ